MTEVKQQQTDVVEENIISLHLINPKKTDKDETLKKLLENFKRTLDVSVAYGAIQTAIRHGKKRHCTT